MSRSQKPVSEENIREVLAEHQSDASDIFPQGPVPFLTVPNSGLYSFSPLILAGPPAPVPTLPRVEAASGDDPAEAAIPLLPLPVLLVFEELRLDVDGNFPQMKASGRLSRIGVTPLHWIANVQKTAANTYSGSIFYKEGTATLLPQTQVKIVVSRSVFSPTTATASFSGGGATRVRTFDYKSRYFHPVDFEFDVEQGVSATLSYQTNSHPNRPASLATENLTIANVYRRAGFDVTLSGGNNTVPTAAAGGNAKWSDMEMHDAMQAHWSKFNNSPQWALWTLFAGLHETGSNLGGVMFDDIGPNHRQGTSLFVNSFIKNQPAGDPAPAAFVQRMIFWTACHEMGHSFNLAHSWQKAASQNLPGSPWIPLANEPEARSFMNYPYFVNGGTTAFFANFPFRFSDQELLFLRHAPFRFVQQGNADWFDHHGFEQGNVPAEPKFALTLELPRKSATFDFLEPVVLHMNLRNSSDGPVLVDEKILESPEHMTVVLKKRGKPARQLISYAQRCWQEKEAVLKPGESMRDSLFVSAGRNGWDLSEPGFYTIQAALHLEREDVVSEPLTIRVAPPKGYDEEFLAQDFFSDDVGRVLTFDGSGVLETANETLREVSERMPNHRAAVHARIALAGPLTSSGYKRVEARGGESAVRVAKGDPGDARELVACLNSEKAAIETLGEIDYRYYCGRFAELLKDKAKAAKVGK